jgi:hypothetical protein
MSEIWTVKKVGETSFYGIISTSSKTWWIATDMLEKHAILICKLFNDSQKD